MSNCWLCKVRWHLVPALVTVGGTIASQSEREVGIQHMDIWCQAKSFLLFSFQLSGNMGKILMPLRKFLQIRHLHK